MKYEVKQKLYDPFTSKLKVPGDIIKIEESKEKYYGGRIKKKATVKKAVK